MFLVVSEEGSFLSPIMPLQESEFQAPKVFEITGYNSIMEFDFDNSNWLPVMFLNGN